MSKVCLIRQPSGLGDIIFCLKIAEYFKSLNYEVIWPVISSFMWLNDYLDNGIEFINKGDNSYKTGLTSGEYRQIYLGTNKVITDDFVFLPLQDADKYHPTLKIMESKYVFSGDINHDDWVEYFKLKRNYKKEDNLFRYLGLTDGEEYCLISKNYGSPPNYLQWPIKYYGHFRVVSLEFINGYTLFDWSKVIENASIILMVDSSINFLMDKLKPKSSNICLYSRRPNNWSEIDYLFKTDYKLMN